MDFKEYIKLHRQEIYSTICNYVQIKNPIEHYKITRDYSDRQGSYRRPGLIMLTGQMFGAKIDDLIIPAAAMQLSEDWILVHDDVEDHSELRRGKTSLNKLYGLEIAVNAGDAGHIIMWKMLKDYLISNKNGVLIFNKFLDILEKTVEGQFLDINFIYNKKNFENINEDLYFKIINSKTCYYTVYGPMQLGAISAGSNEETLKIIEEIGTPAGIAFQITDDVLDLTADEKLFGKQKYGDLYEGKITLIILNAYKNATNEEKNKINSIYSKLREQKTKQDIEFLLEMINKYNSIEYAKKIGEHYAEIAKQTIDKNLSKLPNNEYSLILLSAIHELYSRDK